MNQSFVASLLVVLISFFVPQFAHENRNPLNQGPGHGGHEPRNAHGGGAHVMNHQAVHDQEFAYFAFCPSSNLYRLL